jgi:DnaJ family protein C protein 28
MGTSKQKKEQQECLEELQNRDLRSKLDDHQTPANEHPPRKKPVSDRTRQLLIDRLIQEAMENGEFDNLPGKGKPLVFDDNPYLEPGQELAFDLLKKNNFAPEWIERDKEIRRELEEARGHLTIAWQQRQGNRANEAKWQAAMRRFEESLNKLNRKIDDLNLMVPVISLQRSRLRLADELQHLQNMPDHK